MRPAKVFATAWIDRNANHTYEAEEDILIATLVDENGDDVLNAGDEMNTYGFPSDLSANPGFVECGVTTHTVESVFEASQFGMQVKHSLGHEAIFAHVAGGYEAFSDGPPGDLGSVALNSFGPSAGDDFLRVEPLSVCQPTVEVHTRLFQQFDNSFLDVAITP